MWTAVIDVKAVFPYLKTFRHIKFRFRLTKSNIHSPTHTHTLTRTHTHTHASGTMTSLTTRPALEHIHTSSQLVTDPSSFQTWVKLLPNSSADSISIFPDQV